MTYDAVAPAPQRATDSIILAWGQVNIPLSIFSGTESTGVGRKEFLVDLPHKPVVSVGRRPVRKDTGGVVDDSRIVRKAQATNGQWVPLSDAEIADCTSPKGLADIETFVPVKHLGAYLAKDVKQVRPKVVRGDIVPGAEKAYALFLDTLKRHKVAALVKVAVRGPAKYALITADGDLVFIHTADGIRQPLPINRDIKFAPRERSLATSLVQQIGISDTPPTLVDDTAKTVQQYVDDKEAGNLQPAVKAPEASVEDLLAALEASVVLGGANVR